MTPQPPRSTRTATLCPYTTLFLARLPHARESAMLPAAKSERQVSSWNSDCSGNCSRRIGSGPSWRGDAGTRPLDAARGYDDVRSEEHTSELQSLMSISYAVFCLKKKKKKEQQQNDTQETRKT